MSSSSTPRTRTRTILLTCLALTVVGTACQSATQRMTECGGAVESMDGRSYCVRKKPEITETGFDCPQSHPHRRNVDAKGLAVCSKTEETMPEEHGEKIRRKHGADDGDETKNGGSQTPDPAIYATSGNLGFQQVSVAANLACGITTAGQARCWGDGTNGLTPPDGGFRQLSVGPGYACGVRRDETVDCWGQLDDNRTVPEPSGTFRKLDVGGFRLCGITTDERLECWHDRAGRGELGGDDEDDPPTGGSKLVSPPGKFVDVSTDHANTCAVEKSGDIRCWGDGTPHTVPGNFLEVTSGGGDAANRGCGLDADGDIMCWFDPSYSSSPPTGKFTAVEMGDTPDSATCAVGTDQQLHCFGDPDFGTAGSPAPSTLPGDFQQVAIGADVGCGLRTDDTAVCWPAAMQPPTTRQ